MFNINNQEIGSSREKEGCGGEQLVARGRRIEGHGAAHMA